MKGILGLILIVLACLWLQITPNMVFSLVFSTVWPILEPLALFILTIRQVYPLLYYIGMPLGIILTLKYVE